VAVYYFITIKSIGQPLDIHFTSTPDIHFTSTAITTGMCISGAAMGDKFSPLSDSTNLTAGVSETNLFDHVKAWSPMIPWTSCGAHHTLMLGVSPIQYAPYAFIPLLAPVIALAEAYTGRLVIWADGKQSGLFSKKTQTEETCTCTRLFFGNKLEGSKRKYYKRKSKK
jgi:Na+/H+ antiporter nhaC